MPVKWKNNIKLPEYNRRVHGAIVATCEKIGQESQDELRDNVPWTDRTSHARQGQFYRVEDMGLGKGIKLHLAGIMDYYLWLQVANGGKYANLIATLESFTIPHLQAMLKAIFR